MREVREEAWRDLRERLEEAERTLRTLGVNVSDTSRLDAKAQGVRLALSYMAEYERQDAHAAGVDALRFDFGGSPSQVDVETKGDRL